MATLHQGHAFLAEDRADPAGSPLVRLLDRGRLLRAQWGDRVMGRDRTVAELRRQVARLEAELGARKLLAREIDHRAKNAFQMAVAMLVLQARRSEDPTVAVALTTAAERLRVLAELHRALHEDGRAQTVDLRGVLESICAAARVYAEDHIAVELECEGLEATPEAASCIGLFANEAVTNALKHAFPGDCDGRILVAVSRPRDGSLRVQVDDDGVGLEADRRGLGFQLMELLAGKLDGELSRTAAPGRGTTVRMDIPEAGVVAANA